MQAIDLNIAETAVRLEAQPFLVPSPFRDFLSPASCGSATCKPELSWTVETGGTRAAGTLLMKTPHTVLYQTETGYSVEFPPFPLLRELSLFPQGARLTLSATELLSACPGHVAEAVLYGLEVAFFYAIQQKGMVAAHSASLVYRGKAYLFLAPSGTGKTTHVKLWKERFGDDVPVLDGDVAACGFHEGGVPCAWGLPWCGTSGEYQNRRVPLGGFVFLQRAAENKAVRLSPLDGTLRLAARCFTPSWTKEMAAANFDASERLAAAVPCYQLECLPDAGAVQAILDLVDC